MIHQRTLLVCVALLLVAVHRQQPHLSAFAPRDDGALPAHLSDTGLFAAPGSRTIARANRPFSPQYPLWTDGAAKRRWVYLPEGAPIDASNPRRWEFPVGTRFWKEFSFAGRPIETRFLWKASANGWLAGSYVWSDDGTDAALSEDGLAGATEIVPGRHHNVPSRADCVACHGAARAPLGFNPLQLSNDRDPAAIHGETLTTDMITLRTLLDEHRLPALDLALRGNPPRVQARDPQTRTVLGYLSGNCSSCHNGDGQISAQVPSFAYADLIEDGERAVQRMIGLPTRWQAPARSEGTLLIDPGVPDASALLLRMRSRRPSSQMPPLGTVLQDQQALEAIGRWIASLPPRPVH